MFFCARTFFSTVNCGVWSPFSATAGSFIEANAAAAAAVEWHNRVTLTELIDSAVQSQILCAVWSVAIVAQMISAARH